MLSHEEIHNLTQFKSKVKRKMNQSVELSLLAIDPIYCNETLDEVEEFATLHGDEDLLLSVLTVRNQMGFFNTVDAQQPAAHLGRPTPTEIALISSYRH